MSIRGASSLRHPFQDLCRKLESEQKDLEISETYPSRSEIWKLTPQNTENEYLGSGPEGEAS
ncbi:hypothetical protein EHQ81_02155 [Leptospira selangorensis]|uniref:Uncharacterized protein n=1 Tax=Leptospira selangorensis TaxID=2484982 RepID=A0A5F2BVI9_9LEPT|nr:hypothetical protein [Leptospira selangorensis]TGM11923.1 hypothetical protein EHQ82_20460 [Leptospira selangorensis]TGM15217.1 hypothetical protein EHQ81_02155 [Leptospira selangorensis]